MIFYIPAPWDRGRPSASQIRPQKMLEAFKEIGYEVDCVFGTSKERKQKISDINKQLKKGVRYDLCYVETSTMPTLLTDPRHLPLHPFLDYGFWWTLKREGVPIGIFYRDIQWKFPEYRKRLGFLKAAFARLFYRIDHLAYAFLAKKIFVPSMKMAHLLPDILLKKSDALPPGAQGSSRIMNRLSSKHKLKLIYVGGIGGNVYDLSKTIEVCKGLDFVELMICCRKDDWNASGYEKLLGTPGSENISILHLSGTELKPYYESANLALYTLPPVPYLDFAVSFKIFEYAAFGLPMIGFDGTEAARLIRSNGLGRVVEYNTKALELCLREIQARPSVLEEFGAAVIEFTKKNLWTDRAETVKLELLKDSN